MKHLAITPIRIFTVLLFLFMGTASHLVHAATIFVNPLAGGANDGSSWANAYTDLQSALAAASAGDEIWVAAGLYIPSVEVDVDASGGSDSREKTFQIPSGVMLYGGFAGGEVSLSDRNWFANPTILSGDLDMNDTDLDGNNIAETPADIVGDNAYHVVYTENVSSTTRLDGFVVTAGYAGNIMPFVGFSPNRDGAGWLDLDVAPYNSSPGIYNCGFQGNFAEDRGGAIHLGSFQPGTYHPIIKYSRFSGNEAVSAGGAIYMIGDAAEIDSCSFDFNQATRISGTDTGPGAGGAIFLIASNATINGCLFQNNSATGNPTGPFEGGGGGAVYINQSMTPTDNIGASTVTFINSGFYNNSVGGNMNAWGGALVNYSDGGNLTVNYIGCVFSGNSATDDGGAIAHFARVIAPPTVLPPLLDANYTNCTFYGNDAGQEGGALYMDGSSFMGTQILSTTIENSILYGNMATNAGNEIFTDANSLIAYSLVQGSGGSGGGWDAALGTDGGNNLDTDPMFSNAADPDGADNALATADDGLFPAPGSPAVDAGNSGASGLIGITTDYIGEMRVQGGSVDMGPYEQAGAGGCGPIPAGLTNMDIGNTGGYVGSVCYDMGTYEIDASGSDIWGREDGFHFVYREMMGNGEIIARVDDIGFNSFWDMAGVMMRADLADNSKNVVMGVNAGGLAFFQRRKFTNGYTAFLPVGSGATPKWVKIVRYGNFFVGFRSNNGTNWHWSGLFYVHMPHKIYVGLATSTHLPGTPNAYELSNFSVNGVSYKQAPYSESQLTILEDKEGPRAYASDPLSAQFKAYPNPAVTHMNIEWVSEGDDEIVVEMLDMQGRIVRRIYEGPAYSGQLNNVKLERENLPNAMYVVRMRGLTTQKIIYLVLGD